MVAKGESQDDRIDALRDAIRRAFPPETYAGVVTPYDHRLNDPDVEDEKYFHDSLKGRKWTDLPRQLLDQNPDGYVRLTNTAFAAFLAAWLIRSLEDIGGENEVRDFVVFAFSPKHHMVPDTTELILERLRSLNQEQRRILQTLLVDFAELSPTELQRKLAVSGAELLDTLG